MLSEGRFSSSSMILKRPLRYCKSLSVRFLNQEGFPNEKSLEFKRRFLLKNCMLRIALEKYKEQVLR